MLESLFNKVAGLRVSTKVFSCEYCKVFKNSFFYRTTPLVTFDYCNQSKIFREITGSKFQGQHATHFNKHEGLCPATKTEVHRGFSNGILRNFKAATFENNFGGLLLKRKQRGGEEREVILVVSGFHFFQGSYLFIKP